MYANQTYFRRTTKYNPSARANMHDAAFQLPSIEWNRDQQTLRESVGERETPIVDMFYYLHVPSGEASSVLLCLDPQ